MLVHDWSDVLGRAALLSSVALLLASVSVPRLTPQRAPHPVSGISSRRLAIGPAAWPRSPLSSAESGRAKLTVE